jgi:hypothetical protein
VGAVAAGPPQRTPKGGADFCGTRVSVLLAADLESEVPRLVALVQEAAATLCVPMPLRLGVSSPCGPPWEQTVAPLDMDRIWLANSATPPIEGAVAHLRQLAHEAFRVDMASGAPALEAGCGHANFGASGFVHCTALLAGRHREDAVSELVVTDSESLRHKAPPAPTALLLENNRRPQPAACAYWPAALKKAKAWRAVDANNLLGCWLCVHVVGDMAGKDGKAVAQAAGVAIDAAVHKAVASHTAGGVMLTRQLREAEAMQQLARRIGRSLHGAPHPASPLDGAAPHD